MSPGRCVAIYQGSPSFTEKSTVGLGYRLLVTIQPPAYVVSHYILHYGNDKRIYSTQVFHPLSVTRMGAVTSLFYHVR